MYDIYNELEELCDTTSKEIKEANDKIRNAGGKLSPGDTEYLDRLTHMLKSIKTTMAMIGAEDGYSSRGSYGDYYGTYARGRNAKRDSMGRYASRMSRSAYSDKIMSELHELMEDAPDDKMRQKFQRFITEMEQM